MSFNNNSSTDLSRFSVGEIVDLSGVPDFYNAGSSKYLRSATATASSNLSATAKTNLANAGSSSEATVLAQSALSSSYNAFGFYASYPIARIPASNISVVPAHYFGTTAVGVGVVTSAGLQAVSTGQTSNRTSSTTTGTNGVVASNDTTIFSYCFSSATALSAAFTTNGTTWTAGTVTGIPVFATNAGTIAHASQVNLTNYTVASTSGWKRGHASTSGEFAVFWCGARFVLLATDGTNFMLSLSTNGLAWGGDNTVAVIGATTQAQSVGIQFYRNGNNCYLNVGTAYRFSTDGGITWAASTFGGAPVPQNYVMQYNETTPAKLVIQSAIGNATAYYSSDSGQTWSASRPLPFATPNGGLYYKGSILVASSGSLYNVSTDDGVTWTVPTFPIGVLGSSLKFFADDNRFYAGVQGHPQLLTSSDGITWTIVTLTQSFELSNILTQAGLGILSFDSNTVVLIGYNPSSGNNQCFFTTNGGVTWTGCQYTVANVAQYFNVGNAFTTPDGDGIGFAFGSASLNSTTSPKVLKTDITAGGAFYRTGATAITPIRANAFSYVRVE